MVEARGGVNLGGVALDRGYKVCKALRVKGPFCASSIECLLGIGEGGENGAWIVPSIHAHVDSNVGRGGVERCNQSYCKA